MALIPWRPFGDLERFFGDEDWFLPLVPHMKIGEPAMDVYEKDKDVVAEINLPGIDPDKVEVSVRDGVLRVSGTAEEKKEEKEKGYFRREIRRGSFERAARLPVPVKEDAVEATYEKGVLKVVMPKQGETKRKMKIVKVKAK